MRNLPIRHVIFIVMSVLCVISLAVMGFYTAEVSLHLRHAKAISLNNNLSNVSLRLASVTAVERGLAGTLENSPDTLRQEAAGELDALRMDGEREYQRLIDIASQFQRIEGGKLIAPAVEALVHQHSLMVQTRNKLDAFFGGDEQARPNGEVMHIATGYIEAMTRVRNAAAAVVDSRSEHGYHPDLLLKEHLFTISENAGRERALLGATIAGGDSIPMEDYHALLAYRSVVDESLAKILAALQRYQGDAVAQAVERLHRDFLGRFEGVRAAIYQASAAGQPYPMDAVSWFNEASHGIDSVLNLSDALNEHVNSVVYAEEQKEYLVVIALAIGILLILLIFLGMGLIIHKRVLSPLEHLEKAALHIAGGDLSIPVESEYADEVGSLARAFESMRKKLLFDIDERERSHEEMRKLMRVVDQTADLVAITDRRGVIEYVNEAFERTTGYLGPEVVGKPISFLRSGEQDKAFYQRLWHTIEQGEPFHARIINRCKNGDFYYEEKTISPLRNERGEITHYVSTGKDVSDNVQVEQQLMQSEKLASIGQLAAGVAHEINNPVGYISSNLGSLENYFKDFRDLLEAYEQETAGLSDEARERIEQLRQELDIDFLKEDIVNLLSESEEGVSRVKQIVQDLKDFSRVDSSEWHVANLHHGLDSTLNIVNNEIKYKAEVLKEYGELPDIECVPSQLNQVFMNLLVNAAHAIEDRGRITIRTGARGDEEVWVEVEDTGTGISEENMKKLFEPFFTTKPVGKGTGLGLSLTYGIVQKHGGHIDVESEVGKGTRFRVSLPVHPPKQQADENDLQRFG